MTTYNDVIASRIGNDLPNKCAQEVHAAMHGSYQDIAPAIVQSAPPPQTISPFSAIRKGR
jgi:hypothetical protein